MRRLIVLILITITLICTREIVDHPAYAKKPDPTPTPLPTVTPPPNDQIQWVRIYTDPKPNQLQTLEISELQPARVAAADGVQLRAWEPISTTEEILELLDAYLVLVWENVQYKQLEYYEMCRGCGYMQGLISHSAIPADGDHQFPDLFLTHPSDFPASWLMMDILPFSPAPYAFWMDTYNGPWGEGFTFSVEIEIRGQYWTRTLNYGGEIWRAHTWETATP